MAETFALPHSSASVYNSASLSSPHAGPEDSRHKYIAQPGAVENRRLIKIAPATDDTERASCSGGGGGRREVAPPAGRQLLAPRPSRHIGKYSGRWLLRAAMSSATGVGRCSAAGLPLRRSNMRWSQSEGCYIAKVIDTPLITTSPRWQSIGGRRLQELRDRSSGGRPPPPPPHVSTGGQASVRAQKLRSSERENRPDWAGSARASGEVAGASAAGQCALVGAIAQAPPTAAAALSADATVRQPPPDPSRLNNSTTGAISTAPDGPNALRGSTLEMLPASPPGPYH
uniref:Uncharacterized protein n=1 Tax=Plectus sambesii TaxID=2011161 RepID=A0A914UYN7_9BILA